MQLEIDVEEEGSTVVFVPNFFKADLPRGSTKEKMYKWYLNEFDFRDGALVPVGNLFHVAEPPETVSFEELEERAKERFGDYSCPYMNDE